MANQKDTRDTYGDIDTAATKLKIKGSLDRFDPVKLRQSNLEIRKLIRNLRELPEVLNDNVEEPIVDVEYSAMFLEDIFCGIDFLVVKRAQERFSNGK